MGVVYRFLSVLGAVIPYAKFVPWVREHGLNLPLLLTQLFSTRIGGFFGLDVILSAVTLLFFIRSEGGHRKMRLLWLPVAATCLVGVSCGLPLFLYLRERQGGMTRRGLSHGGDSLCWVPGVCRSLEEGAGGDRAIVCGFALRITARPKNRSGGTGVKGGPGFDSR